MVPSSASPWASSLGVSAFQVTTLTPSSAASGQVVSLTVGSCQGGRLALPELATPAEEGRVRLRLGPGAVPTH